MMSCNNLLKPYVVIQLYIGVGQRHPRLSMDHEQTKINLGLGVIRDVC